jgi:hypothetical protein
MLDRSAGITWRRFGVQKAAPVAAAECMKALFRHSILLRKRETKNETAN